MPETLQSILKNTNLSYVKIYTIHACLHVLRACFMFINCLWLRWRQDSLRNRETFIQFNRKSGKSIQCFSIYVNLIGDKFYRFMNISFFSDTFIVADKYCRCALNVVSAWKIYIRHSREHSFWPRHTYEHTLTHTYTDEM